MLGKFWVLRKYIFSLNIYFIYIFDLYCHMLAIFLLKIALIRLHVSSTVSQTVLKWIKTKHAKLRFHYILFPLNDSRTKLSGLQSLYLCYKMTVINILSYTVMAKRLWKWICIVNHFYLLFKKNLTFHWSVRIWRGGGGGGYHHEINVFLKYTLDKYLHPYKLFWVKYLWSIFPFIFTILST